MAALQEEKVYQAHGEEEPGEAHGEGDEDAQFRMLVGRLGAQKVLEE